MKNMRLLVTFSLLLALFCCQTIGFAQYDPKAEAILSKVSSKYQAYKSFKAKFTYTLEGNGMEDSFSGSILVKEDRFHLDLGAQEIFNNGSTVWTYLKEENEVNVTDYAPEEDEITPSKIYTLYKSGYKYTYIQEKLMDGVKYHIIDLIPEDRNKMIFKVRLLVSTSDNSIKSWKMFEKTGNRYTYTIDAFTPNPSGVNAQSFVFDKAKYKDVLVNDLR